MFPSSNLNYLGIVPDNSEAGITSKNTTLTCTLSTEFKCKNEVWMTAFSHNGRRLATSGDSNVVDIWDVDSTSWVVVLHCAGAGPVGSVAWSPDDSFMVTCFINNRFIMVWDVENGICIKRIYVREPATFCVWSPANTWFIVGSYDRENSLWQSNVFDNDSHVDEVDLNHWLRSLHSQVYHLALTGDGERLVVATQAVESSVSVYHTPTRTPGRSRILDIRSPLHFPQSGLDRASCHVQIWGLGALRP
ncbi:WD40-repeat-containing domain protein [Apodospora peruviana]|uniref:WD40-repeat-containing domain protein n=1 Tax=Apodospora peruviana TaxID=516989 RepID=A0AAE0ID93_9PEZI|nr:WD40-repeat-containing domain protein [Apodospora peruviana]